MTAAEVAIYEIRIKDAFSAGLSKLESQMDRFEGKTSKVGDTMKGVFGGGLLLQGAEMLFDTIASGVGTVISLGMEMEQTKIAFETMIGNADKAAAVMETLKHFADVTPFSTNEMIDMGRQLMNADIKAEHLVDNMTMLGDVASGLKIPIGEMTSLWTSMKQSGVVTMQDLKQFGIRSIPIYRELGKVVGGSTEKVKEMMGNGEISFAHVRKAFKNMTADGAQFGGMMAAQALTLGGRWSTLKAQFETTATGWGLKLTKPLGILLDGTAKLFDLITKSDWGGFAMVWDLMADNIMWFVEGIWDVITSLFPMKDGMDGMQRAVQTLALMFYVATTPMRFFIGILKLIQEAVVSAAPLINEFNALLDNFFKGNFGAMGNNMRRIENFAKDFSSNMNAASDSLRNKEKETLDRIMHPEKYKDSGKGVAQEEDNTADLDKTKLKGGKGDGSGSGAGIEKVNAGTRNVTVNIQTIKLADSIVSSKADMSDVRIHEMLTRAMVAAVNDVNIMGA
jgi:tape measure domain-containing protein